MLDFASRFSLPHWTPALLLSLVAGIALLSTDAVRADVVVIDGRIYDTGQSYPDDFYPHRRTTLPSPIFTEEIEDSTLINPVIVGSPSIEDSTLINPVIVPGDGTTIIRGGTFRGQDNPACMSFRSIRVACQ